MGSSYIFLAIHVSAKTVLFLQIGQDITDSYDDIR